MSIVVYGNKQKKIVSGWYAVMFWSEYKEYGWSELATILLKAKQEWNNVSEHFSQVIKL